ncbi:uncharacterized protein [Struthio camelus]|uniref:uncharacterized protein isoform X1 n=1 Tax=Struthio camelus TaxID=8801 RepID=UPI00360427F4
MARAPSSASRPNHAAPKRALCRSRPEKAFPRPPRLEPWGEIGLLVSIPPKPNFAPAVSRRELADLRERRRGCAGSVAAAGRGVSGRSPPARGARSLPRSGPRMCPGAGAAGLQAAALLRPGLGETKFPAVPYPGKADLCKKGFIETQNLPYSFPNAVFPHKDLCLCFPQTVAFSDWHRLQQRFAPLNPVPISSAAVSPSPSGERFAQRRVKVCLSFAIVLWGFLRHLFGHLLKIPHPTGASKLRCQHEEVAAVAEEQGVHGPAGGAAGFEVTWDHGMPALDG